MLQTGTWAVPLPPL